VDEGIRVVAVGAAAGQVAVAVEVEIARRVRAGAEGPGAGVHGAGVAIIAVRSRPALAHAGRGVRAAAGLHAIAEEPVVTAGRRRRGARAAGRAAHHGADLAHRAQGGVEDRLARVRGLVAAIRRAGDAVVAVHGRSGPTAHADHAALHAVAEGAVVAARGHTHVHVGIGGAVAVVVRARDGVVAARRRPGLAAERGRAELGTVAEYGVVAQAVVRHVHAAADRLGAGVECTAHAVVAGQGSAREAVEAGVADLDAIAGHAVVAEGVVGRVVAAHHGIAGVGRAADGVRAVEGRPRLADAPGGAGLGASAGVHVVAVGVDRAGAPGLATGRRRPSSRANHVHGAAGVVSGGGAGVAGLVAGFEGAAQSVVRAGYGRARGAASRVGRTRAGIADLDAVAEEAVVADGVDGRADTCVRGVVTHIVRAGEGVVTDHGRPRGATLGVGAGRAGRAGLVAVAEEPVIADGVARDMLAGVAGRAAAIRRAGDGVVAGRSGACDAAAGVVSGGGGRARLHAGAEESVVAHAVVCRVEAGVAGFVAAVDGAAHSVVAVRCGPADATRHGIGERGGRRARFDAVAEEPIPAGGVHGHVAANARGARVRGA